MELRNLLTVSGSAVPNGLSAQLAPDFSNTEFVIDLGDSSVDSHQVQQIMQPGQAELNHSELLSLLQNQQATLAD
jgi:hypothetical protein